MEIPALFLPREYNQLGFDALPDTEAVVIGHFHLIDQRPLNEIEPYFRDWLTRNDGRAAPDPTGLIEYSHPRVAHPTPATDDEARHRRMLNEFINEEHPYPADRFAGRGIVICAGGWRYFACAYVCIRMLRHLGCALPIQMWHLGAHEMTEGMRALVEPLGVETIDAEPVRERHPVRILNGWEMKAFALLHCRFEEALLLDADNVPVLDPTYLFTEPDYLRTGAIFWPDFGRLAPDRPIWRICGIAYRDEPEFESGQILVNKRRSWQALRTAMHLNEYSDFYYSHIHGDKETFHMAWRKIGQEYAMPARGIDALEGTMCQHDFDGRRVFQHRNFDKWRPWGGNRQIGGFQYEEECRGFCEELAARWEVTPPGARRFRAQEKTAADQAAAARLLGTRFDYHRVGYDRRMLAFRPDGRVGEGAGGCELFWDLCAADGETVLEVYSEDFCTMKLREESDGIWRGAWLHFERMPVELTPIDTLDAHAAGSFDGARRPPDSKETAATALNRP